MSVSSCCSLLASALASTVFLPGTTTYNGTETSYWSLNEADLAPACVVTPHSSQDVSTFISVVTNITGCDFAIKGHGHNPAAGFANINGGVTLDMTSLASVSTNSNDSVATVGAGATWFDVYQYLDPLGKTVAGGRNGAVGVGGLTLGGGISYWSPQVGFTCDTVENFEIVLPSAEIVNANATSYPDLFRALKGGANNFGVVTHIDFATVSTGQILGGSIVQDISYRDRAFKAFADIAGAPNYDVHASIVSGTSYNSTSKVWSLSHTPIYTEPVLDPPVYQELFSIPNITSTVQLRNLSIFADEEPIPQFNWLFLTGTYGVSADLLSEFFDIANQTLYPLDDMGGALFFTAFEPLPTVFTEHGAGTNSLGTSPLDGNNMIMLISVLWMDASVGAAVNKAAQDVLAAMDQAASRAGLLRQYRYMNYAGPTQDPIGSYGVVNDVFLDAVARKYDPKGVFQTRVPGGFKIRQ